MRKPSRTSDPACVVERGPVGGPKIEITLYTDAIQKERYRFALRGGLDDLQIADKARSDIGLGLMHFNRSSRPRQNDCRGETRWARTGDSDQAMILHSRGMLSRHVGGEFR